MAYAAAFDTLTSGGTMPKTAIFAKLTAQPGKGEELLAGLSAMLGPVQDEKGTELYVLHVSEGEPDVVRVYEVYTDGDAVAAHMGSEAMKAAGAAMAAVMGAPPEITMTTIVSAKGLEV
ncbi:MAG: antibiotic biosynthesis monooxygenase [Actinobacteria bacterium]|nr:antibiotic biosynthesis monooxygenase [Actinomycetota bacterium]MBI3256506.1 antibiotic biosynthesis monooxygenase [Actinomycetota bacterium]